MRCTVLPLIKGSCWVPFRMVVDTDLSDRAVRTYLVLKWIAEGSDTLHDYKGNEVASLMGVGRVTFYRALGDLIKGGYIKRHKTGSPAVYLQFIR
jgi:predicted transcriptional regulator